MAKSFKQNFMSSSDSKPNSQKDILDFFNEEQPLTQPINTNTIEKPNIQAETTSYADFEESTSSIIRQTFMIDKGYLEKIKNYVYLKKTQGQFDYSQKEVLHDALNLLFQNTTIPERPDHVKKTEMQRSSNIMKGKKNSA